MQIAQSAARSAAMEWLQATAREVVDSGLLEVWTAMLDDAVIAEAAPAVIPGEILAALHASNSSGIEHYLSNLSALESGTISPTPAQREIGRLLASRGHDLTTLLRSYRVVQRVLWGHVMKVAEHAPLEHEVRGAVLQIAWDFTSRALEQGVEGAAEAYVEESERRLRGALARREELVASILGGDDVDLDEAMIVLGHSLHRTQLAFVAWASSPAGEELLEKAARGVAGALGAPTPLMIRGPGRELWGWVVPAASRSLHSLQESLVPGGVQVAFGEPGAGAPGFRRSHREALRARQVANSPLTRYADVAVVSLLAQDRAALREFVQRVLGPLAAEGEQEARLRETLLAYFVAGGGTGASTALAVHRNTVLYRLQQAAELMGRPLDEARLDLQVALHARTALGDEWL